MYSDFKTNFDKLWEKDGSFSIYHRNNQNSATEKFKLLNELSPPIMNEVFQVEASALCSLRDKN